MARRLRERLYPAEENRIVIAKRTIVAAVSRTIIRRNIRYPRAAPTGARAFAERVCRKPFVSLRKENRQGRKTPAKGVITRSTKESRADKFRAEPTSGSASSCAYFYRKFLFIKSGNRSSAIFGRNTALKPDKQLLIFAEKKLFVAKELFIRKKHASDKLFPCGRRCVFTNCIKLYLVNKKCITTISCGYFFQKSKIVACATYKEARNMIYSVGLD